MVLKPIIGKFTKNVVTRMWEATYRIGKSVEIAYFRSESESIAYMQAKERKVEGEIELIDFHAVDKKGSLTSNQIWGEHDEYISQLEKLRKEDTERPMYEIVDQLLGKEPEVDEDAETQESFEYKKIEEKSMIVPPLDE